jgi:hypothetical protein
MCGQEFPASPVMQVSGNKLRTLNELRCDFWKRKTDTLAARTISSAESDDRDSLRTFRNLEALVKDFDKQRQSSDLALNSQSISQECLQSESPHRFRKLADLEREFKEQHVPLHNRLPVQEPKTTCYGRSLLLGFRQPVSQLRTDNEIRILCAPRSRSLACKAYALVNATRHVEDPELDDMNLLVRMEERLAKEIGADVKNEETFGGDLEPWSFEQAVVANEKLFGVPVTEFDICTSTAACSRVQSECQSCNSESSTPRALRVPWGNQLPVFQ